MDAGVLKDWLAIIMSALALGGIVFGWFTAGGRKAMTALDAHKDNVTEELRDLDKRLDGHDARINAVEREIEHLPDKDAFNELKVSMVRMEGRIEAIHADFAAVKRMVHLLDEHLRGK